MTSPRIALRSTLISSTNTSPRKQPFEARDNQLLSPKLNKSSLANIIPTSVAGQVKLFNELASPLHKHVDSPLSSKFLSTSLADFKNFSSSRVGEKEMTSPKLVRHVRGKTMTNDELVNSSVNSSATLTKANFKGKLVSMEDRRLGSLSPGKLSIQTGALAFRDELKKEAESSPLIKVSEEALYYDTVKHLDECGKCWAQYQKNQGTPFKLKCKMMNCTAYQRDFPQHKRLDQGPVIKNSAYETAQPKTSVDLESTMKKSFQPYKPNFSKAEGTKATLGPNNATFNGRTSYNTDFYNLGDSKAFIERYPQAKTTLDGLPLAGTSNYKTNHGNFFVSKGRVTRWPKKADKSPFVDGVPFLSQTTSGDFFQPFKTGAAAHNDKGNQDYQSIDSFPNQFQSTYVKDFNGKQQWKCPAKVFMENNLPPHMGHLRVD